MRLESDWDVHAFDAGVVANIVRYTDQSRANYQDWNTYANGRLDITDDLAASAGVEFAKQHEDRGSPDSAAPDQDNIEFYRFARRAALDYKGAPIFTRVTGEWDSYDYQDNQGFNYDAAITSSTRLGCGSAPSSPLAPRSSSNPVTTGASTVALTISGSIAIRKDLMSALAQPTT